MLAAHAPRGLPDHAVTMPSPRLSRPLPAAPVSAARSAAADDGAGKRAGVLGLVLGLHALALALLLASPTAAPPLTTPPLVVSLVAPPQPEQPPAPRVAPPAPPKKANPAPAHVRPRPAVPQALPEPTTTAPTAISAAPAAPPLAAPADTQAEAALTPPAPPTLPRFDAAYLHNQTPYPPLARRLRESGTVRLRVRVSAEGLAENIEILSSSGSPRLDDGAREAVRRWRFIPARQGDQAVASSVVVPIIYKLEES
jgi:periplasmic protein TonB